MEYCIINRQSLLAYFRLRHSLSRTGADTVIVLDGRVKTVEVNDEGQVVVTYNNGKEEIIEVEEGTKVVLSDKDGEQYYVDNGTVSKAGEAIAAVAAASSASQQVADADKAKELLPLVRFAPAATMQYGFDSLVYPALRQQYLVNTVHGKEYVLPYKSVATGASDPVEARMPRGGFSASGLSFRINQNPVMASPATDDNVRTVNVTPMMSGDEQILEAVYMLTDTAGKKVEETLGQLNVVAYDKQLIKLYVVPVGTSSNYLENDITTAINKIYSQAVVEWNTEWLEAFNSYEWDINNDNIFEDVDSDERMDYTPEMKVLIRAYKDAAGDIDKQAVYVFLFNGDHRNTNLEGYMPFNKQFAFVFTKGMTTDDVAHNIAHEIAHGTFNLRHTFSDKNAYYQSRGTTQNLMDYTSTNANGLNKYQWDLIHDPKAELFSWLEEEGEGAGLFGGKLVLLDERHTLLLNHVYDNNNEGDLIYKEKIEKSRQENATEKSIDLDYIGSKEKDWIRTWKLRTSTSDEILAKIIKKIQNAEKGKKIEKMSLNEKGIYIGKFKLDNVEYPIAIYSEKSEISNLVKVQVSDIDDLDKDENKKHVKSEETFIKYMIIAFYEEGTVDPVLVMQIEKFDISKMQNTKEKWLKYLNILETKKENSDIFEVSEDQLKKIFPGTSEERIKEVVESINKYSTEFEISTIERMSHFLGQIGAETGGLKKLEEGSNYTAKNIFDTFLKPNLRSNTASTTGKTFKYCDLVVGYDCSDLSSCPGTSGHSDCTTAINVELDDNDKCKWSFDDFDKDYDVKSTYISSTSLFDYVYGCRMGNGAKSTNDGSTYLGKGFIHLTGKDQYKKISDEWNTLYPDDKKEFDGKDIDLLETNVDVAMKASMIYWQMNKLNEKADEGTDNASIDNVGKIVNGSGNNLPNGYEARRMYSKSALENLKK